MSRYVLLIAVVVVILVVVAIVAVAATRRRRSQRLRQGFGPEYDRTLAVTGDKAAAEQELATRQERRRAFDIRPLGATERQRYSGQWLQVQERFVDVPRQALQEADRLVGAVMSERGYPMNGFEQMADDVSVDHPNEVSDYRAAHAVAEEGGDASTEQMRVAMQRYRSLFDSLLRDDGANDTKRTAPAGDR